MIREKKRYAAPWDSKMPLGEDAMQKIITLTACLGMFVLIAACGHGWRHSQVPESKWDADYADCVYQAESKAKKLGATRDPAQDWGAYGEVRYLTDKCMEEKGYVQAGDRK